MGVDALVVRHASAGVPAQIARWSTLGGHQRRRRLARAPDPGPARLLHDPPARSGSLDGPARRHRGRHQAQPGGPLRRRSPSPLLGAEVTLVAPPDPAAAQPGGLAGRRSATTSTTVLDQVDVVYLLRMQRERMTEALLPSLREYTAAYGLTPDAGRPGRGRRRLIMHPGPMNRGVEIAAEVADRPNVGRRRPGAQRRAGAHGRAVPAARDRERDLRPPVEPNRWHGRTAGGRTADRLEACRGSSSGAGRGRPRRQPRGRRRRSTAGRIVGRRADLDVPAGARVLDAGGCIVATGPGRPAHPSARAGPGGRRDHRVGQPGRGARRLHRRGGHAQHRAGHRLASRWSTGCTTTARGARAARSPPSAAITVGRAGERAGPHGRAGRAPASRMFTDDGTGVQDDRLMRRAMEYASGLARVGPSPWPSTARSTRLAAGGHMHEGEWSAGSACPASRPRPRS